MELLELAIEAYRWIVGFGLIVFTWFTLRKLFSLPKDELEEPDYMVKIDWRK